MEIRLGSVRSEKSGHEFDQTLGFGEMEIRGHEDEQMLAFGQMEILCELHKNLAKFLRKHLV